MTRGFVLPIFVTVLLSLACGRAAPQDEPPTEGAPPERTPPAEADRGAAYSPVHGVDSRKCKNDRENASEADDFRKVCKGFGGYELVLSGFDRHVDHEIRTPGFSVMLFPLEDGEAGKYARADQYDVALGKRLEWRLDEAGAPYAVIVHATFYERVRGEETSIRPGNEVAGFVFLRGLKGFEGLKLDLPTTGTPYDPDAQARTIAAEYLEQHRR